MRNFIWCGLVGLQASLGLSSITPDQEDDDSGIIPLRGADLESAGAGMAESERLHGDASVLYPGMIDSQRIGDDLFKIVRYMPSRADMNHMDSRLVTPDATEIGLEFKYMNDCLYRTRADFRQESFVHPLVNEFRMFMALEKSGIVPDHARISPAVRDSGSKEVEYKHGHFTTTIQRKYSFSGLPDSRKCEESGAETRFLSFVDVGIPVAIYFDFAAHIFAHEVDRLVAIISFGIQSLRLVRKLHAYGVVHGYLDSAAIRFRHEREQWSEYNMKDDYLIFVDLQDAFLFREAQPKADYKPLDSPPWHLLVKNLPKSRRDDIYSIAESMVNLITEERLRGRFAAKVDNIPELVELKQSYDMFDKKGISYYIGLASNRHPLGKEFLGMVRALKEDEEPPYDQLIAKLEEITSVLQKDRSSIMGHIFG